MPRSSKPRTITLSEPGLEGAYEVERVDGSDLLLRRVLTSADEIRARTGTRALTDEELERHFGGVPTDAEG